MITIIINNGKSNENNSHLSGLLLVIIAMKKIALVLHLWSGLVFGAILVVLGLTGSALSWMHELDTALNPGLLHVPAPPEHRLGQPMGADPDLTQAVADRLTRDDRYGKPSMLELPASAGDVYIAWYRPAPGTSEDLWALAVSRQVMLDPGTLQVTGERNWGEAGMTRALFMPTLFHLHRYLLAGEVGKVVVAITGVALLLTVASGMVLWWPRMARVAWWRALTVRHGGSWPRFSFQLHRAGGVAMAPLLLVSAVSGIHFNMPQWVTPVVSVVAPVNKPARLVNRSPGASDRITVAAAVSAAQARFPDGRVSRVSLPAKSGQPFEVRVRQPGELRKGPGATRISIDSGDGRILRVIDPERSVGGDRLLSWMFPLHTGEAFGTAGRIVISLFGVVPLLFFITGLVIWIKLRKKKLALVLSAPKIGRHEKHFAHGGHINTATK